ncbi:Lrp/AsnC family transcriptional regulator [Thalassococcus sp. CAU 1522]|uniref:Lrp/AsnC family transcriptional regulator n=1 Tax=Thalassococcus arenae TaxID=2851652 RepID=A0ABS6N8W9_9RHOB|nr:Lrp/AsnC family transcriptional regulator [Thalassococcus arenae]MBV2360455.1 Lrp/AsnC family transcriptional regulator [Thalassococcus arenae]
MKFDKADIALLETLQRDGQATAQTLGEALNLSPSQAGRRRQRLEEAGVIRGYTARLDAERLGLDVQAFVQVQLARHGAAEGASFTRLLATRPEITSAWTMTGEADYLLRVFCADLPALNRLIHEVLLAHPVVARVHSQIVLGQTKPDAPLPVA